MQPAVLARHCRAQHHAPVRLRLQFGTRVLTSHLHPISTFPLFRREEATLCDVFEAHI